MTRLVISYLMMLWLSFSLEASSLVKREQRSDDTQTQIKFFFDREIKFKYFLLQDPSRLVFDFLNLKKVNLDSHLPKIDSRILAIRSSQTGKQSRLVVEHLKKVNAKVSIRKLSGKTELTINLKGKVSSKKKVIPLISKSPNAPKKTGLRDVVIVIDPGHGGKDPGATSGSLLEKKIVLDISKRLAERFSDEPGFRAELTRSKDKFVRLLDRTSIARSLKADFFISIHADSIPRKPRVRGAGVFILSSRGETSEIARTLQDQEKLADLADGADLSEFKHIGKTLTDMSMGMAVGISKKAGQNVLNNLKRVGRVHKKTPNKANFVVLRNATFPSLLIETGFLSNRQDARRLANPREQAKIADAIFEGIVNHFDAFPPPDTFIAWRKSSPDQVTKIRVRSGDTLSGIAAKYGLSLAELKKLNKLKSDKITLGQKLNVSSGL